MSEFNAELLIGREVVDANGKRVGHIEEMIAEHRNGELVIMEFHVGTGALWERLLRRQTKKPKRIKWKDLDLSDPKHPRLK